MKTLRRSLLWMLALALPASLLLLLPLRAQEKPAAAPEKTAAPSDKPVAATDKPAAPAEKTSPPADTPPAPEAASDDELPPDERVSADNNLSFPVDI